MNGLRYGTDKHCESEVRALEKAGLRGFPWMRVMLVHDDACRRPYGSDECICEPEVRLLTKASTQGIKSL